MVPFERAMVVSYRLSNVTIALSLTIRPKFAIECLRRSTGGVGQFGANFGEKGIDRCKPNFNTYLGLFYAKDIVSISSAV